MPSRIDSDTKSWTATRRGLVLGALVSGLPLPGRAAPLRLPVRIGFLASDSETNTITSFRQGLTDIGYREGVHYIIEVRSADLDYTRFPGLLDELLASGIDILITAGPASRMSPLASQKVPALFAFSGDPVDAGFVRSMSRTGGNLTGVSFLQLDLCRKRVGLLREAVPSVRRIAVLSNAAHPGEKSEARVTREEVAEMGLEMVYYPVRTLPDVRQALQAMQPAGCDALLCFPEALTTYNRREICDFARQARMPSMFGWAVYAEAGGLLAYGPNRDSGYARLAFYVDRIVKGASAGDLPVEQPVLIELCVNASVAREIGVALPPSIIARADIVLD